MSSKYDRCGHNFNALDFTDQYCSSTREVTISTLTPNNDCQNIWKWISSGCHFYPGQLDERHVVLSQGKLVKRDELESCQISIIWWSSHTSYNMRMCYHPRPEVQGSLSGLILSPAMSSQAPGAPPLTSSIDTSKHWAHRIIDILSAICDHCELLFHSKVFIYPVNYLISTIPITPNNYLHRIAPPSRRA
jgi:hypothetical protein